MAQPPINTTYTATGIVFAKANANNIAIANTQTGVGNLTEVIDPVTLEVGKITSDGTTTITGIGTDFNSTMVGKYLFYYDETGTPALLGKVASVATTNSITLVASSLSTQSTPVYFGLSSNIVAGGENLLIRIPCVPQQTGSIFMPRWNAYRTIANDAASFNSSAATNLNRISPVKNPGTIISDVNISFTLKAIYGYAKFDLVSGNEKVTSVFASNTDLPQFCFAEINPYGNSGQSLPPYSLFKLFANERFGNNGILVTTNYPFSNLAQSGY